MAADLFPGAKRCRVIDLSRLPRTFREQLSLATAVHSDEPPRGFLDGLTDSDQSMIPQNRGLILSEGLGDSLALRGFVNHASELGEQSVIFIERAGILGDGIEQTSERGPRFSIQRMRVCSGNHIGTSSVHSRMDGKRCAIDGVFCLYNFAVMIHQNQVGRADLTKVHPERVHPEMVEPFRIARGNVPRYSFVESELRKKPECGGQHLFAMPALLRSGGKYRGSRHVQYVCGCSGHLALPSAKKVGTWDSRRDYIQCPPR